MISAPDPRDRLSRCVQVFDDALPAPVCEQLVQGFEALRAQQIVNGRQRRDWLSGSAWTELDIGPMCDASFKASLMDGVMHFLGRYNEQLGLTIPVPPTAKTSEWILKRYRNGGDERFQPHFDSIGAVANRYLVFLWYLNDVAEGGETAFVDLDLAVKPKTGRLLVFPPYWMFQHEGRPPVSGDKYILSTYLLF
ncbi:MAG: 2OG-Fe(II) oxygenase [Silanimonas sp.]